MTQWGLDTLFNPAKRHMDEEKRRLQSTREESGDSSGGKRIDFDGGKVTIRRAPAPDTSDDTPADPAAEDTRKPDAGKQDAGKQDAGKCAPSPAAVRAAHRRGRTPR